MSENINVRAVELLAEFRDNVKLAHGTGNGDEIDGDALDWPDLGVTYAKACELLDVLEREAT